MSITPGATPDVYPLPITESPFSSTSLVITIGPQRVPFSIHQSKLDQTSFFEAHAPLTPEDKANIQKLNDDNGQGCASSNTAVKSEDGSLQSVRFVIPDYHVEGGFFNFPAAFDILVKNLYNEPPSRPSGSKQVKTLLQAYGIATTYKYYILQNRIMDCLRAYHSCTNILLDDLVWAANRFGDGIECPLNAYFVEQVAFEIAEHGLNEFSKLNSFTKRFLEEGKRTIRFSLFEALARYAQNPSNADPAVQGRKFHVYETGVHAGKLKP